MSRLQKIFLRNERNNKKMEIDKLKITYPDNSLETVDSAATGDIKFNLSGDI